MESPSLIVTTNLDVVADDGLTSLREAIAFANSSPDASTVTFDGAVFSGDANSVIRLTQGEITITEATTIDGSSATDVVISGDALGNDITLVGTFLTDGRAQRNGTFSDNSRLFLLNSSDADTHFAGISLTGGRAVGDHSGGGAISSVSADVSLENVTIAGQRTTGHASPGAAIYAGSGDVSVTDSAIYNNTTSHEDSHGGAIFAGTGDVFLINSNLIDNRLLASADGAGIYAGSGDIIIQNSTLASNTALSRSSVGGGAFAGSGDVTIIASQVANNSVSGGRIGGGGVHVKDGDLFVQSSTFYQNSAVSVYSNGGAALTLNGSITVIDSTFSANKVSGYRGIYGGTSTGAAIFSTAYNASNNIVNSTFNGNFAAQGAAISAKGASLLISNTTITGNYSIYHSAAIEVTQSTSATLTNSIVSGNGAKYDYDIGSSGLNDFYLVGKNIINNDLFQGSIDIGDVTPHEVFDITAEVGSTGIFGGVLGDNGGPVQTVALLDSSTNPAIDAGNDADAPATDARGASRIDFPGATNNVSNISDLGAYEVGGVIASFDVYTDPGLSSFVTTASRFDTAEAAASAGQAINVARGSGDIGRQTVSTENLTVIANDPFEAQFVLSGVSRFTLIGDTDSDVIAGQGSQTMIGGSGDNALSGGGGDDTLEGGAGGDFLDGDSGLDTASYANANGAVAFDRLVTSRRAGDAVGDTMSGIERIVGSAFADDLRGANLAETLEGGAGNDLLVGRSGVDLLIGGRGNDTLLGSRGDDILEGGTGADFLGGDIGIDAASYSNASAAVGVDLENVARNLAGEAVGDRYSGIENAYGSSYNDDLRGGDFANLLRGRDGNDTLRGREGDDTLEGGRGADLLFGQEDADAFLWTGRSQGGDTVWDFETGIDTLQFSSAAFGGLAAGELERANFRFGVGVDKPSKLFVFDPTTSDLYFDPDGSGDAAAIHIATIRGVTDLSSSDIEIV